MPRHYNIRILGSVQAVSFRHNAKIEADKLGIFGFVVNQPDGSVYVEVEGAEEKLQQFIEWCKSGPRHARVSNLEVTKEPVVGYLHFEIRK